MKLAAQTPALLPTYARADVTFVSGEGCRLTDADGKQYLDFAGGIAVVGLGHLHPGPLAAAQAQLERLWHVSNLYWTEPTVVLAELLSERFGGAQSFFCNSGAEAIEAAVKYARKATGKPGIVALEDSFHGRTIGALSVTGQPKKREAFGPLLDVTFVPANDVDALERAVAGGVGLVLLEPVQGEGGVVPLAPGFVAAAAELAAAEGALLCFDEVQTGVGRTGTFFCFEQLGVRPQLVTMAKGLANGLPIGALLVADEAAGAFAPGDHASTFGGNPVPCAAACAVVNAVDDDLLANVRARGAQLTAALSSLQQVVTSVRGPGLLIGAELERPAAGVVDACLAAGLLVTSAGENVLRLTPPLVVTEAEADEALAVLREVLA